MLSITPERIVGAEHIFYYNTYSQIYSVQKFSKQIHKDLKAELNITYQIRQRIQLAQAVRSESIPNQDQNGYVDRIVMTMYDKQKIERMDFLYDLYIKNVLNCIQSLYYEVFNENNFFNQSIALSRYMILQQQEQAQLEEGDGYDQRFNEIYQKYRILTQRYCQSGEAAEELKTFVQFFMQNTKPTGLRLQDCYIKSLAICAPHRTAIEKQIDLEFPIDTFSDRTLTKKAAKLDKK